MLECENLKFIQNYRKVVGIALTKGRQEIIESAEFYILNSSYGVQIQPENVAARRSIRSDASSNGRLLMMNPAPLNLFR